MARHNVEIKPGDTVVVPGAPIVYVLGEVGKPGGYVLGSAAGVTVLRVVPAAGGPTRNASVGGTKMLRRRDPGTLEGHPTCQNPRHAARTRRYYLRAQQPHEGGSEWWCASHDSRDGSAISDSVADSSVT
jgi:protein involved in polysaccharide export with SLBB domain